MIEDFNKAQDVHLEPDRRKLLFFIEIFNQKSKVEETWQLYSTLILPMQLSFNPYKILHNCLNKADNNSYFIFIW